MKLVPVVVTAAILLSACKPARCGPTSEARREARLMTRRYPAGVSEAQMRETMSKLEKAITSNPKDDEGDRDFELLVASAAMIRKHASAMEKPSRGGDSPMYLVEKYKTERSHLTTGLDELARICGD